MFTTRSYESQAVTVPPQASCIEVADQMDLHSVGSVVVAEDDRPLGIITDRDLVCRVVAADLDAEKTLASDVMTPNPVTAARDDDLGTLLAIMSDQAIRRLPLLAEGRLCGVVSLDDVMVELTSYLFNANQGILGALHDSRRTVRHRRRLEAREDALHELHDQIVHLGSEARERLHERLEELLARLRKRG